MIERDDNTRRDTRARQAAAALHDFAGESLEDLLQQQRLDVTACLTVACNLAQALAGLHAGQVMHRNLRPAAILVEPRSWQVRIADMRAATPFFEAGLPPAGVAQCDLPYCSPEQTGRMNRAVDYRTDFYTLGITLYRMLTGKLPFEASDPLEWVHCHLARIPAAPIELDRAIPQPVSDIVMKLLAKAAEDRYQSARGLLHDLERCLDQWQAHGKIVPFVLGEHDIAEHFRIPHKLYGRETEIAALVTAFEHMAASGQPELVLVSGYSGIGKSSLVRELHRPVVQRRGYFISGKFDQYQRDIPYVTITQAFRELIQQILAESEARIAMWKQRLGAALGGNARLIVDLIPQLRLIVGSPPPVAELPPTEARNRFQGVLRQFIAVFAQREHPLTLFLDDLQWVDAASLALIEDALTHPDLHFLLIVGAYRDNEVDATHPLMASLDVIRQHAAPVTEVKLAPLPAAALNQLVADTLHAPTASCTPLTHLVFERTGGNPFFFIQFFDSLHKEGLLQQDAKSRNWQWDLDQIEAKDFADNVVDLVAGKLLRLPAETQDALRLAACLGTRFDAHHLALVSGQSQAEIKQSLTAAVRESLILFAGGSGKFLHDRIQQAAYSLIPEQQRSEVHLRIGRVLLSCLNADELAEHLFDVANQLNRGASLITDQEEKAQVAELNLRAGRKAKAAAAYTAASLYLAAGMAFQNASGWDARYRLSFDLWLERANCEFLSSNFEFAEQLIAELLQRGASNIDKAAVYRLKIDLHITRGSTAKAVDSAVECMRLFAIDMPAHPSREQVMLEYERVWANLNGRKIEDLIDLPLMADAEMQAALDVLAVVFAPAYFSDHNLLHLHLCQMVNISLQYGNAAASAHGYAWFGVILGPAFGRYQDAYRFGKLACDLVEKHDFRAFKAKANYSMEMIAFWNKPIGVALDYIRVAFKAGMEIGDLTVTCYSSDHIVTDLLVRGDRLAEVDREASNALDLVKKAKFADVEDIVISQQRFIRNMRGMTAGFSTYSAADFDQEAFEATLTPDRMSMMVCWYHILKLQARFLSEDIDEAMQAACKAQELLFASTVHPQFHNYCFYYALTLAARYEQEPPQRQAEFLANLREIQGRLQQWAEHCPQTFLNTATLVAAEIARISCNVEQAMQLYEAAIRSARENGFIQNAGVANQLAAQFYLARGVDSVAGGYLREARHCFRQWGADGKVRQLEALYPELLASLPGAIAVDGAAASGAAQLDALAVAKASQAVSGEIVLDKLVDSLMRTALENAGAQNGALLLVDDGQLILAAETKAQGPAVTVQVTPPTGWSASSLPASILNYVRRSHEQVLLADAVAPHAFSTDPYLARARPKSLLCLPIMRQAELVGLLYLENRLLFDAFPPQRIAVLELLASQAAISLENAKLYRDLQQENAERRQAESSFHKAERLYRTLWETTNDAVVMFGLDMVIRYANPATLQIFGYRPEELEGQNLTVIQPERLREGHRRGVQRYIETGIKRLNWRSAEAIGLRRDGQEIPIEIAFADIELEGERLFVGFIRDNTERKRAEEQARANQALLQSIIDTSTAVIYVKDLEGRFLLVNHSFTQVVNASRENIIGKTDYDFFDKEQAAAFQAVDRRVVAAGIAQEVEEVALMKDGLHTFISSKAPLRDAAGTIYAVCGISTDITERKQAEEELKRHRDHLEELVAERTDELTRAKQRADVANQAKSAFLASMSHELRTPLNAVLGYAQILKRETGLSERQTAGLNTIQQSGEHLLTLINDILDLAKIEAGKLELSPHAFNLPLFLRTVGDIVRVKAEEKSLLFDFDMQANLPLAVQADENRLRQVLLNLLSNAVKFTDRGQITLRVHCAPCCGEQARLRFEIQDTGIGIDLEQQALLFRPFLQVGEVQRRFGGTGLGLAISRQLVRLMSSDIQVDSQPGKGSCFWFEIAVPTKAELAAIPAAPAITGHHGPRKKVLIVDDVESNRAMLVDLLSGLAFVTAEAVNGQEGLTRAQTLVPDIIIMDMVMPVMDGLEATRRLRTTPGLQAIPVIAVSASATPEDETASLAAGANTFLPKPIEQADLLRQIGTLLNLTWDHGQADVQEAYEGALVAPPRAELEALHVLALTGNMGDILLWIGRLEALSDEYRPFAHKLRRLAVAFQSKAILKLVEAQMNADKK